MKLNLEKYTPVDEVVKTSDKKIIADMHINGALKRGAGITGVSHLFKVDEELEIQIREQVKVIVHVLTDHINNFEDKTLISEINKFISGYSNSTLFKDHQALIKIYKSEKSIKDKIDIYLSKLEKEIENLTAIVDNYRSILLSLSANLDKVQHTVLYEETNPVLSLHKMHLQNIENKILSFKGTHESLSKFKSITFPQLILNIQVEIKRGVISLEKITETKKTGLKLFSTTGLFFVSFLVAVFVGLFTTGGFFVSLSILSIPMMIYGVVLFLYGLGILTDINKTQNLNINQLWEKVIVFSVGAILIKFIQKVLYTEKNISEEISKLELSFNLPVGANFLLPASLALLAIIICSIVTLISVRQTKRLEQYRKEFDKFLK